jgi:hypothetical protein
MGHLWLLSVDMTQHVSRSKTDWWWLFAGLLLPALIIGSVVGGPPLSAKCIILAALVVAQSTCLLAKAKGVLASAMGVVLLKATNTEYLTRECLVEFLPLLSTPSVVNFIPHTLGGGHSLARYPID